MQIFGISFICIPAILTVQVSKLRERGLGQGSNINILYHFFFAFINAVGVITAVP